MKKHPNINQKKSFEILASTPEAHKKIRGFYDEKHPERKPMMMNKYGQMVVHDSGVAYEIRSRFGAKKYGGDGSMTVVPVEDTVGRKRRAAFSVPALPWKEDS